MTTAVLIITIKCIIAVIIGWVEGNVAVHFFNKIPARWLCEYGKEPDEKLLNMNFQRIKSIPWKYLLSMMFAVINIKLAIDDWQFAVPATLGIWILLELAMADVKYKIVPDQLLILLAITGIGLVDYHRTWQSIAFGALTGLVVMSAIAVIGKLTYRRETLGGGDIKLFTVLGFLTGPSGVLLIFAGSSVLAAVHATYLLITHRIKPRDTLPMVPYIAICTAVYMVFFWGIADRIVM